MGYYKAVIVPFTHKNELDGHKHPKLMREEIKLRKIAKYLGVMLDQQF